MTLPLPAVGYTRRDEVGIASWEKSATKKVMILGGVESHRSLTIALSGQDDHVITASKSNIYKIKSIDEVTANTF